MFILTSVLGIIAVAAIALSPLYARRLRPFGSVRLGAAFISLALAIPLLCAATPGTVAARSELFLCSFVLMLVGAVLLLAGGDDSDDEPEDRTDGEPPWWPEFEEGFRSYARRRRPLAPTR